MGMDDEHPKILKKWWITMNLFSFFQFWQAQWHHCNMPDSDVSSLNRNIVKQNKMLHHSKSTFSYFSTWQVSKPGAITFRPYRESTFTLKVLLYIVILKKKKIINIKRSPCSNRIWKTIFMDFCPFCRTFNYYSVSSFSLSIPPPPPPFFFFSFSFFYATP